MQSHLACRCVAVPAPVCQEACGSGERGRGCQDPAGALLQGGEAGSQVCFQDPPSGLVFGVLDVELGVTGCCVAHPAANSVRRLRDCGPLPQWFLIMLVPLLMASGACDKDVTLLSLQIV